MVGVGVPHTDTHGGCRGASHRHSWWVQGYLTQTSMVGAGVPHTDVHGGCGGISHRHPWWVRGYLTQTSMLSCRQCILWSCVILEPGCGDIWLWASNVQCTLSCRMGRLC